MTLMPGDIITTGTPPGVGMGMKPQRFLKRGDTLGDFRETDSLFTGLTLHDEPRSAEGK